MATAETTSPSTTERSFERRNFERRNFNLSERDRQALQLLAATLDQESNAQKSDEKPGGAKAPGHTHLKSAVEWLLKERIAPASKETVEEWQERSAQRRSDRALAGGRTEGYHKRTRYPVHLPEGLAERANRTLQREAGRGPVQLLYMSEALRLALFDEIESRGLREQLDQIEQQTHTDFEEGGEGSPIDQNGDEKNGGGQNGNEGDEGYTRSGRRWTAEERKAHSKRQKALNTRTKVFKKAGKKSGGRPPLDEAMTANIPAPLSSAEKDLLANLGERWGMNHQQAARQIILLLLERPLHPEDVGAQGEGFPEPLKKRIVKERAGNGWAAPSIEESRSEPFAASVSEATRDSFEALAGVHLADDGSGKKAYDFPVSSLFRLGLWRTAGEEGLSEALPPATPPL